MRVNYANIISEDLWLSWLERFIHIEEVGGSNPSKSTNYRDFISSSESSRRIFFACFEINLSGKAFTVNINLISTLGFSPSKINIFVGSLKGSHIKFKNVIRGIYVSSDSFHDSTFYWNYSLILITTINFLLSKGLVL